MLGMDKTVISGSRWRGWVSWWQHPSPPLQSRLHPVPTNGISLHSREGVRQGRQLQGPPSFLELAQHPAS